MADNEIQKKTIDFFTTNSEGYISPSIIKFNFLKLGLTAMLISGLSFSIGLVSQSDILTNNFITKSVANMTDQSTEITKIKSISNTDWASFNSYLDKQKHIYDAKVNYVSVNISNAYYSWVVRKNKSSDYVIGISAANNLKNELANHHEEQDEKITEINNTYNNVISNKSVSNKELNNLLSSYNLYKNNIFINNNDIDEKINSITFNSSKGTLLYFQEKNVYNNINKFDLSMKTGK